MKESPGDEIGPSVLKGGETVAEFCYILKNMLDKRGVSPNLSDRKKANLEIGPLCCQNLHSETLTHNNNLEFSSFKYALTANLSCDDLNIFVKILFSFWNKKRAN